MRHKSYYMLLTMATTLVICGIGYGESAAQNRAPVVLTRRQFNCLLNNAGNLKIGKAGAYVVIGKCPPAVRAKATSGPPRFEEIFLKPSDVNCLVAARKKKKKIAVITNDGKYKINFDRCGAQ